MSITATATTTARSGAPRELTWSNQGGSIRSRPIEKIIREAALTVTMLRAMKLVITAMIDSVPRKGPENVLARVSKGVPSVCSDSSPSGVSPKPTTPL